MLFGRKAALAALLVAAACSSETAPPAANQAVSAPDVNAVAEPANSAVSAPAASARRTFTLAGDGLAPGLAFGMPRNDAVAAAREAFGVPTGREHNEECGEGPMDFITFGGLQLAFQEGRLTGWALNGPEPALRTLGGLAIGAPRSVLGEAEIDRESTLGPEFNVNGVGGILDESETRVEALWAGQACQFR